MKSTGKVTGIVSNLVTVLTDGPVSQNELCFINCRGTRLMAEVIKVSGRSAAVQVFESTRGLRNGDEVEFEDRMLEVTLGPGLLSSIYDGLQNTLPFHASQEEIESHEEWSLFAFFLSPTDEFYRKVLYHREFMEIVAPDEVRTEYRQILEEMLEMHA